VRHSFFLVVAADATVIAGLCFLLHCFDKIGQGFIILKQQVNLGTVVPFSSCRCRHSGSISIVGFSLGMIVMTSFLLWKVGTRTLQIVFVVMAIGAVIDAVVRVVD
jgi:hypothetical protein